MANEPGQPGAEGILIQGADGALYFIPNENLKSFQLPDDLAANTKKALVELEEKAGLKMDAVEVGPQINQLSALQGPIGRRETLAGVVDATMAALTPRFFRPKS
jgi:hypothetical protein